MCNSVISQEDTRMERECTTISIVWPSTEHSIFGKWKNGRMKEIQLWAREKKQGTQQIGRNSMETM